jgi:hypothetical protein
MATPLPQGRFLVLISEASLICSSEKFHINLVTLCSGSSVNGFNLFHKSHSYPKKLLPYFSIDNVWERVRLGLIILCHIIHSSRVIMWTCGCHQQIRCWPVIIWEKSHEIWSGWKEFSISPLIIWRAAVFWPCKGSIIISSLIVNWYEWLDKVLTVFCEFLFEFGVWVKIPRFFYGTKRSYRVLYKLCFVCLLLLLTFLYFVGVINSSLFCNTYLCFLILYYLNIFVDNHGTCFS